MVQEICRSLDLDLRGQTSASYNMRLNYEKCLLEFERYLAFGRYSADLAEGTAPPTHHLEAPPAVKPTQGHTRPSSSGPFQSWPLAVLPLGYCAPSCLKARTCVPQCTGMLKFGVISSQPHDACQICITYQHMEGGCMWMCLARCSSDRQSLLYDISNQLQGQLLTWV